jgi:hypothetical protein
VSRPPDSIRCSFQERATNWTTTPQKPVRAILPEIVITDMDRDEQLIFEDDIPVDDILDDVDAQPSPGTPERAEDVAFLYREIIDADPAFAGVPVTSPKPTSMPLRPAGGPVGPLNQLLAVPDVSPVDYAKLGITLPPDVYGLTPVLWCRTFRPARPNQVRPASPPSPPPNPEHPSCRRPRPNSPEETSSDAFTVPGLGPVPAGRRSSSSTRRRRWRGNR